MEDLPQPRPKSQALHGISTDVDGRHSRIMAKIRDSLLSMFAALNPSISIHSDHGLLINRRVQEIFKSFHTPTHPPYALMIQRAVTELSEEIGSSEQAISDFIRMEYKDLPWAHVRILGLHLRKLCVNGELVCTESGRYKLLADDGNFGAAKEMSRKENKKQKRGTKTKNHRDIEESMKVERSEGIKRENGLGKENAEQIRVSQLQVNGNNEPSRMLEKLDEQIAEQSEALVQSIEISKNQSNSVKGFLGKTEQHIQSQLLGIQVTEERDEAEGSHGKVAETHKVAERLQIGSIEGLIQENNVDSNRQTKEKAEGYLLTEKWVRDGKEHHLAEQQNGVNDALNESLG